MWVQVLEIAGQLPGGLTRANLLIAIRATEMTAPMYLEGIKWNMNGNADSYWLEGTEVGRYDVAKQTFVQQGDIIDLSGKSSNCAWGVFHRHLQVGGRAGNSPARRRFPLPTPSRSTMTEVTSAGGGR